MSNNYFFLIPLVAAVGNLALVVIVLRHDRRSELNQAFAFGTVAMVFWNLNIYVFSACPDVATAFYWSRVFRVGTLFLPVAVAHFFYVFSEARPRWVRRFLGAAYATACVLVGANVVDLLVSGLRRYPGGYYFVGTSLYSVFACLALVCAGVTFHLLLGQCIRSSDPRKRFQSRLWLLGTSFALPLGLTNFVLQPGSQLPPLGNLANTVYVAIIAYGIVRHRLMDVDIVLTKGIAYGAVWLVLIVPTFALTIWLESHFFGHVHYQFSAAMLVMLVAVGVLFPALRLRAQSRIQQSFFREKQEYRAALMGFTRSILRIVDRDRLIRELVTTLSETLRLEHVAIWLWDPRMRVYSLGFATGNAQAISEITQADALVTSMRRRQEVVLRDELEASADLIERDVVAATCRSNGWEVCIPLTMNGELVGLITLGPKGNRGGFSVADVDLLNTLAGEAAIAFDNAHLYEELRKSQDIIHRADRLSALGTLAAGIAHEVRNPLVSIQTFFQLAPERLHDEEFFTTFLGVAAGEVKRISDLIAELLSFARSPARTLGPANLSEVAERVARLLDPEARKHKLTFTRRLSSDLPTVYVDADQIKQVLINLVLNAIEATAPGGEVSLCSRLGEHQNASFVQLEVHDSGVGIPEAHIDDVFNPFFTTKEKGTGLGLAIAHQIIAEHGGSIVVESRQGSGTSFFLNLPTITQHPEASQSEEIMSSEDADVVDRLLVGRRAS